MAVTARRCLQFAAAALLALPIYADRAADVRSQLSRVANALTARNAAEAMIPFDSSFPQYAELRGDFEALNAFEVTNELDVTDEQDTDTETKLIVNWTITLTDLNSDDTQRRSADIHVRFVHKNGKWKIVDFAPIGIFNPLEGDRKRRE